MRILFTKEANEKAIAEQAAQTTAKVKTLALTTSFGSRVLTKGKVTQTAELDFVLLAGLVNSENHAVHVSLLVAFAETVGIDCKGKGLTAKARLLSHVVAKKLATVENNVITLRENEVDFWNRSYQSEYFKWLVYHYADGIAKVLNIEKEDYALQVGDKAKKAFVVKAYYDECIEAALVMNKVHNTPKVKKSKKVKK